jgi:Glycosyl hydrolase family 71
VTARMYRCFTRLWLGIAVGLVAAGALVHAAPASPASTTAAPTAKAVPVFSYYYIWFNASSWNRAKTDFPLAGRYSSDELSVMRRHVRLAKKAGIDGFIVSWKSTPVLDDRLAALARVAAENNFKLAVIYQGLDFSRRPLPPGRIARDLDRFTARHGGDEVFAVFGAKPVVVISGTWRFTRQEIGGLTDGRREDLLLLASEKSVDGYQRLADLVDGNAYYWSSADPLRTPGYQAKLDEFSAAVHGAGGVWIAPAAAGFDARLIGGRRVIDRRDGETLKSALNAAVASSPDAIGIISWNEFSENSHIEPSRVFGDQSLRTVAGFVGTEVATAGDLDSSAPPAGGRSPRGLITVVVLVALAAVAAPLLIRRRRRIRWRDTPQGRNEWGPAPRRGGK